MRMPFPRSADLSTRRLSSQVIAARGLLRLSSGTAPRWTCPLGPRACSRLRSRPVGGGIGKDMALRHRMLNVLLRRVWTGQFSAIPCSHLDMINDVEPSSQVCDQCVALGATWPELRMCMICGHVGCCEDSRYQHARRHFEATGHPLIMPYGIRGMNWIWCYEDRALLDPV